MISKTILNKSEESRNPYFNPDFSRNGFNYSPFSIILAIGLSYIAIMLRNIPSELFS
jgi:hypothetical protein